jgi:hypothetical protein
VAKVGDGWKCDACGMPSRTGFEDGDFCVHCMNDSNHDLNGCDCGLTPAAPDGGWNYERRCPGCGAGYRSSACPHDGTQKPCPACGKRPTPQRA